MSLNEGRLACWLVHVEDGYQANPYHNRTHAADVLRNLHVIMCRGGLAAAGLGDDLTVLGTYLAAVVHDFEHRGVNNDFLVRSGDGLALLYNDRSPHENHHLAASWGLLIKHNLLRALSHKQKELLRRLMIDNAAEGGSFLLKLRRTSSLTRRAGVPGGSVVAAAGPGAAADALGTWEDDHDNRSLHLQ
eukprot:gene14115-14244_t